MKWEIQPGPLPDYKRPFAAEDFRGYFRWSQALTKRQSDSKLYHACHRNELETILDDGELGLRSEWSLRLPQHGLWTVPGVWTGLNYYVNGNKYGPFVIEFPLSVLDGKQFMVFRRIGGRHRHFFVQYETLIPIYSFEEELWRRVDPNYYFKNAGVGAIWDIVLTQPIPIDDVTVTPVEHPSCIPNKCRGTTQGTNRRALKEVATAELMKLLEGSSDYRHFSARFPVAEGLTIELPELESE